MNNILHLRNVVSKTDKQVGKFNQWFGQDKNTVTAFITKQNVTGKTKIHLENPLSQHYTITVTVRQRERQKTTLFIT